MRRTTLLIFILAAALLASCKKQDQSVYYQATVTAKTSNTNVFYLQLNDTTALQATNYLTNPWGKQVRALIYYKDNGTIQAPVADAAKAWRSCEITAKDSIRTKKPVTSAEGNAGIEIYRSWANTIEDGYLTLYFEGLWGTSGIVHEINLEKHFVADSLCYILKHNPKGDSGVVFRNSGLIAFDIHDMVKPDKSEFDVFIRYVGYNNISKRIKFHYKNGFYSGPYSDTGNEIDAASEESSNSYRFN